MIKNRYDRLAPYYDFLARIIFGKSLLQAKSHCLDFLPQGAKILLIGGGTGQILPAILEGDRQAHVVYLEKSSKMMAFARRRLEQSMIRRVSFIEGDESKLPAVEKFDVVITNFFLDQFMEDRLEVLINLLFDRLNTTGLWLFTDFQLQKGQAHYWWQNLLVKIMFAFFKITTNLETNRLPEFDHFFQDQNLQLVEEKYFFKKLIVSRAYRKSIDTSAAKGTEPIFKTV